VINLYAKLEVFSPNRSRDIVCLSVYLSVSQTITFGSLHLGSSYLHIRVKFVYEGHQVKVKVTGAKEVQCAYFRTSSTSPGDTG